jgi:hypothetical protein
MAVKSRLLALMLGALLTGFLVWGCGDDDNNNSSSNQATPEDREDVADDFGAALADQDEGMLNFWRENGTGGAVHGRSTLDDTLIIEHHGLTIVRVRDFYDELNNWFPLFDPLLTIRMDQHLTIDGTIENQSGNRSVTINHEDMLHVYGMLSTSPQKTLNGDGERTVQGEFASRFRQNVKTCSSAYAWVITDVVFAADVEEFPYPLSGTIDVDASWTRTHENPGRNERHSVAVGFRVTFDGTRYALVAMDGGAQFWIDLDTGHPYRERPGGGG